MPKLTLSIVTWNSASVIRKCLVSILEQSYSDFELFVVDNSSSDETCSIIESFLDPRIKLFRRDQNTGFCAGHNYAIHRSTSDFILLVNPDIVLKPGYIEKAMNTIVDNDRIGTVCGLLLQNEGDSSQQFIDSAGMEMKRSGVMRLRFHGERVTASLLKKQEVFGSDGALPLYRMAMIKDVSVEGDFFDEMFFAHKEDWDVSRRANIFGWKTVFNPECVAVHPRVFKPNNITTRRSIANEIKFHAVKNQLLFLIKNESFSELIGRFVFIFPRQLFIFVYILFFESTSLKAYSFVLSNLRTIINARRYIQGRKVS